MANADKPTNGNGDYGADSIQVRSPHFVRVGIDATLIARRGAEAEVERAANAALLACCAPATDEDGRGVRFGEGLRRSDVLLALSGIADRVEKLEISGGAAWAPDMLPFAEPQDIGVAVEAAS